MCPWHKSVGKRIIVVVLRTKTCDAPMWSFSFESNMKVGSQMVLQTFATLSLVYPCLDQSAHTYQAVSTSLILCLLDYLGLRVFDFVKWGRLMFFVTAVRLPACLQHVFLKSCCKFVKRCGFACSCYLSLCVLLWFGIVCLCFCLDYYGMQLAAEPLPVYCPHPGPGIIPDITRLFAMWEPR